MRRGLFVLVLLVIVAAVTSIAGEKGISPGVTQILTRSVNNEREAAARYDAYAARAVQEGYLGAASLFRAEAEAERTHAARFAKLMTSRGLTPPAEQTYSPAVWSTGENLRNASAAEISERDGIYREAISTCRAAGDTDAATAFDNARDAEVEHANLDAQAARNLSSMKEPKEIYVCDRCGYTTDIGLPLCPVCRADKSHVHGIE